MDLNSDFSMVDVSKTSFTVKCATVKKYDINHYPENVFLWPVNMVLYHAKTPCVSQVQSGCV